MGDEVKEGDLLFSYETDKASFEEEAKTEGTLLVVFYESGDEVSVLSNVAVIGIKGEDIEQFRPGDMVKNLSSDPKEKEMEEEPKVIEFDVESMSGGRIRISPLAKNMAVKMGIDVTSIKGSGPRERIIASDVAEVVDKNKLAAIRAKSKPEISQLAGQKVSKATDSGKVLQSGDDFDVKSIPNIRKLIASAMHNSLQNSAQLTHHLSADARQLQRLRKKFKQKFAEGLVPENVTINDLVCFAVIRALQKFPQANTHYLGDKMRWFKKVHLGLAVDTERGLMVPALKNADDFSITGLSNQLKMLSTQARSGNINPDLLNPEAATFTVSNLGNYGVEMFTPVINLPQTAILGVCAIIPRPKEIEEGVYGFVPMIGLSLTYNHQALDGGEATLFLAEIKNQIENLTV